MTRGSADPLLDLYRRPGFMIRRAHQIATSVFLDQAGPLGVTATQFGLLSIIGHRPDLDQITAARLLGLDRSTTGMVLNGLARSGLVERRVGPGDRRRRTLALTEAGRALLDRLQRPAAQAVDLLLSPLDPNERRVFLRLLHKLVGGLNETTRVPLLGLPADPGWGDADPSA